MFLRRSGILEKCSIMEFLSYALLYYYIIFEQLFAVSEYQRNSTMASAIPLSQNCFRL
jgi:hypothetical protein